MTGRELARERHPGEVREVPTAGLAEAPIDDAALVWVETPSNPGLDVCDLAALAPRCRAAGVPLAVDNTTPTPLGQRPLELGADLSVASASKALSGHADLVLGYVAARDPERIQALRDWRRTTGSIPGPFEAWLLHRSLATLDVRLERQCANALAVAELLAGRDDVTGVRYPGLAGRTPATRRPRRQMSRFGPLVGFDLGEPRAGRGVPRRLRADHRGHELRRAPHDRRAPRPLGTETTCPRASSASARAARTPRTWSPT